MKHSDAFTPETLVDGRFRIVRLLGKGGMGEVYEAEDLELRERVALKVLHRLWRGDEDRLERFRREVHLARKVTHPNVCRVFDVFRHTSEGDGETVFFVTMELLPGQSLEEYLDQHGRMSPDEALPLVDQMTAALTAAHEAGVIHRDLKAGNVMLVPGKEGDLRAVVTDFGLARSGETSGDDSGPDGSVVGSIHYMAPEQVQGEKVTPQSDIFALGVVLFEMIAGFRPFKGSNIAKVLGERLSQPAPPISESVPDVDERWEATIKRCLEIDPADRFPSAAAVRRSLHGPEEIVVPQAPPPSFRWRSPAGIFVLLSLAALATAVFLAWRGGLGGPELAPFGSFDPTQLTTDPGLEIDPEFAPGGGAIVYSSNASGSFEILSRVLPGGENDRAITADGQDNVQPAWSPDGSSIAYYSAGRGGIWIVSANGGEARRVTEFGSQPAFSPDGRSLAFQSQGKLMLSAGSAPALSPSTIWVIDVAGGAPRPITRVGEPEGGHGVPAFSPDGKRLVFSTYYGRRSEIWSVRLDGTGLVPVVREHRASFLPVYTPDGRSLLYSAVAEGERFGLWTVHVSPRTGRAHGEPRLLANLGSTGIRKLAISAEGDQFLYTALSTSSNLWSQEIDPATSLADGAPRPLTTGTGRNNRPVFSPDGETLAFDHWRTGVNRDIWILSADGSASRALTQHESNDSQAQWSAGSERVAFVSERGERRALWEKDVAGGEARKLLDLPDNADNIRLSPDGSRLAYHAAQEGGTIDIWVTDLEGAEPRRLTRDPEMAGFPCWSPDGVQLAFEIRRGEDTHIMVMTDTGDSAEQLTDQPGDSWPNSWSPDGRKVAFAGERDGFWNVFWVDVDIQEEQAVTDFHRRNAYVRYPAWSPKGDQIVFELAETTGDIFWVKKGE